MGEKKKMGKKWAPRKTAHFFKSQKMGTRKKKKWAQNGNLAKNQKIDPQKKIKLVLQEKNVVSNFSL